MQSNLLKTRPNFIDHAKIIGMFLVIFVHYFYWSELSLQPRYLVYICKVFQLFHMPLFFIISGYLYKGVESCTLEFRKIWKTLCLPYILLSAIVIFIYHVITFLQSNFSWRLVIKVLLGMVTGYDYHWAICSPLWFVYALVIIRLIYIISDSRKWMILLWTGFAVVVMHLGDVIPFSIDSALVGFLYFSTGFFGKNLINRVMSFNIFNTIVIAIISLFLLLFIGYYNGNLTSIPFSIRSMEYGKVPLFSIIPGLSGTILVLYIGRLFSFLIRRASSFFIFCSTGMIVTLGFHKLIIKMLLSMNIFTNYGLFSAALYTLITYLVTLIIIYFFKKFMPLAIGRKI